MILVDSNIWLYLLDAETKEHARVKKNLPRLLGDEELLMPTIVQMEVAHHVVRRMGPEASEALDTFLAVEALVEALTGGVATEAARLLLAHRDTGIGGRDAALLVTAKRRRATILTNDKALASAAKGMGLAVENPAK